MLERLVDNQDASDRMAEDERRAKVNAVWSKDAEQRAKVQGWYWLAHPLVKARVNTLISGDPHHDAYDRLKTLLRARGWSLPIGRSISLGCGFGNLERDLAFRGMIGEMDAYDLAEGAIEQARKLGQAAGLDGVRYHVADLDQMRFAPGSVDAVFAHQSVHHVDQLENLYDTVREALRPDGILHLHEFVGPRRFQWTDAQLRLANEFLDALPPRLRRLPSGEPKGTMLRPTIEAMIAFDPSEAVRSSDILPALEPYFEVIEERRMGGALAHLALGDIAQNFDPASPEDCAWLERLFAAEDRGMAEGTLGSDYVVITAVPRPPSAVIQRLRERLTAEKAEQARLSQAIAELTDQASSLTAASTAASSEPKVLRTEILPPVLQTSPALQADPDTPRVLMPAPDFPFPTVGTAIAAGDTMFDGDGGHYLSVALSALRLIESALGDGPAPRRILDLPCGHGRVTRLLRARFPDASITVCDIDRDGTEFAASEFGARGVWFSGDFRELDLGERYDLIWTGSLITHFSELQTRRFLDAMARHMAAGSVLVASSHGSFVAAQITSRSYGLGPRARHGLLTQFARMGYGYRDYPGGSEYGISLMDRRWIETALAGSPLRLDRYEERAWDDHHDILAIRPRADQEAAAGDAGGKAVATEGPAITQHRRVVALAKLARHSLRRLMAPGRDVPASSDPAPPTGMNAPVSSHGWFEARYYRTDQAVLGDLAEAGHSPLLTPAAEFDEGWYLETYPDVMASVAQRHFSSALDHYVRIGQREGRSPFAPAETRRAIEDGFNEAWYVSAYPDVAASLQAGIFKTAYNHWVEYGKVEGRRPGPT